MCGIAGFLDISIREPDVTLKQMIDTIVHRGPDDQGAWYDRDIGIALGHRRLSILDLSPAGHQPMFSPSGRYVIVFNGEIYNHLEIRKLVNGAGRKGEEWISHSDTETLLAGFDVWGIEATIKKTIGMFALAVWDREKRTLTLARDRIGEKPLYYGWQEQTFLFGSELKALKQHPSFHNRINRNALTLLLRHNYISAPHTIYDGIAKLESGCLLEVSLEQREPLIRSYWSALEAASSGIEKPFSGSPTVAVDSLEELLKDSIRQQMVADVPLGAFLSGGIDSSTVVALMQTQSSRPVQTFTIGFHETGYNEAIYAKAVAQHLGTDHTELYITPEEAMAVIPRLPTIYDEPFSDSSQIPTYLVSQLARQRVTVSLSGDAGDELFGGYNRYVVTNKLWGKISTIPTKVRMALADFITGISPARLNQFISPWQCLLPDALRLADLGEKFHKGARALSSSDTSSLYNSLVSHWTNSCAVVCGAFEPTTILDENRPDTSTLKPIETMMLLDLLTYLPDDILTKVDRAAMAVSLETRVPMLDHRVVEFAWRLPMEYKIREGQSKWALRQVLYRHVPKELFERPKMGFGIPLHDWLRGGLREWAEELLNERRLRQEGFFDPLLIRQKWEEHLSGKRNWQYHLWDVLMFQAWLENNR